MENYVTCKLCGFEAKDLTVHINRCHNLKTEDYKRIHGGKIIADVVQENRKKTSQMKYGVDHFTNREAANLSYQSYEGGHPWSDPKVREKAKETKQDLYGDPDFTNREKAKKTCLEKYGVEYSCASPDVIKKRIETLKERYGKVFNVEEPHNKIHVDNEEEFKRDYLGGVSRVLLCQKYKMSDPVLTRVIYEMQLKRVVETNRKYESSVDVVRKYFELCQRSSKVFSFYECSKTEGDSFALKLKRLFNAGKPYAHLKDRLFVVALEPSLQEDFLKNFK